MSTAYFFFGPSSFVVVRWFLFLLLPKTSFHLRLHFFFNYNMSEYDWYLTTYQTLQSRLAAEIETEETEKNLCLECGRDMGPNNPRQLCGKTKCLLETTMEKPPSTIERPSKKRKGEDQKDRKKVMDMDICQCRTQADMVAWFEDKGNTVQEYAKKLLTRAQLDDLRTEDENVDEWDFQDLFDKLLQYNEHIQNIQALLKSVCTCARCDQHLSSFLKEVHDGFDQLMTPPPRKKVRLGQALPVASSWCIGIVGEAVVTLNEVLGVTVAVIQSYLYVPLPNEPGWAVWRVDLSKTEYKVYLCERTYSGDRLRDHPFFATKSEMEAHRNGQRKWMHGQDMRPEQRKVLDALAETLTQRLGSWGSIRWRVCKKAGNKPLFLAVYSPTTNAWSVAALNVTTTFQTEGTATEYKTEAVLRREFATVQHPEELEPTFARRVAQMVCTV
jgi:hypothetical protein